MPVERGFTRLWVPGLMPGWNELMEQALKNRHAYNRLKSSCEQKVALSCVQSGIREDIAAGHFTYLFFEPHRRRDPSNIVSGGVKLIEDALQNAGRLGNDGWKHVMSITGYWLLRKECPGVLVLVGPRRLSLVEAQEME